MAKYPEILLDHCMALFEQKNLKFIEQSKLQVMFYKTDIHSDPLYSYIQMYKNLYNDQIL